MEVGLLKNTFAPEYMDSDFLAVVGRRIQLLMASIHGPLSCKLSESCKKQFEERVEKYKAVLPDEFQRKGRRFSQHLHFKATEYRIILLYTGPVFRGIAEDRFI